MAKVIRGKFEGSILLTTYKYDNNKGVTSIKIEHAGGQTMYPLISKNILYYKVISTDVSEKDLFFENHFYVTILLKHVDGKVSTIQCNQNSNEFNGIKVHCMSYEEYSALSEEERKQILNSEDSNEKNIQLQIEANKSLQNYKDSVTNTNFSIGVVIFIIVLLFLLSLFIGL